MSYCSEVSVSSQTSNVISWEELEEALTQADHATTRADWAEERASHLEGIVRDMIPTLSAHFGIIGFEDMLAHIPAQALALVPAPARASALAHNDDDNNDDDVDLEDF
ncbi:hypothetical protein COCNU_scaffold009604G000010 [Cocos nucifera]|nr:hypothetical protein [Cocos nucifera]